LRSRKKKRKEIQDFTFDVKRGPGRLIASVERKRGKSPKVGKGQQRNLRLGGLGAVVSQEKERE